MGNEIFSPPREEEILEEKMDHISDNMEHHDIGHLLEEENPRRETPPERKIILTTRFNDLSQMENVKIHSYCNETGATIPISDQSDHGPHEEEILTTPLSQIPQIVETTPIHDILLEEVQEAKTKIILQVIETEEQQKILSSKPIKKLSPVESILQSILDFVITNSEKEKILKEREVVQDALHNMLNHIIPSPETTTPITTTKIPTEQKIINN